MFVHAVIGPEHGSDLAGWQQTLNDPDSGVISFSMRPSARRDYVVIWDALAALGKSTAVTGNGRDAENVRDLLVTWLVAHRIEHIIVRRVEWAKPALLDPLMLIAALAGCDVWLCAHDGITETLDNWIDAWTAERLDWDTFRTQWSADHPPTVTTTSSAAVFPDVPDDDFPSFVAACARELSPLDSVTALARFGDAAAETDAFAESHALDEESLAGHLHDRLDTCATAPEMVTVLRGAQLALFERRRLVQVDLLQLLAIADDLPRRATRPPELWARLRCYVEPYRSAACALATTGLGIDDVAELTVDDVADDGAYVCHDGDQLDIEPPARVFVAAQRLARRLESASPDDRLLARCGEPVSSRRIADAIQAARRETGLVVISSRIERRQPTGRTWTRRYGISIQEL